MHLTAGRLYNRHIARFCISLAGIWLSMLSFAARDIPMLDALYPLPSRPLASLTPLVKSEMPYTYERLLSDTRQLAEVYPGLIEVIDIGQSLFGRRLIAIRLGRGPLTITLNGAHHGREWITSALLMTMLDRYVLAYYRGDRLDGFDVYDLLNHVSLWCVPMVNPDGVALVQAGPGSAPDPGQVIALNHGSRDFSAWKANGRGIDLNRQYPAQWDRIDEPSPGPGAKNYRGRAPLTEPESQAVERFARERSFRLHTALHSSGELIYWHFYQQGRLRDVGERIAHRIHALTGYALVPAQAYESGGGYKDWVVETLKAPAFTLEVGRYARNGQVPAWEFTRMWGQVQSLGLLLAQEATSPSSTGGMVRGYLNDRLIATADSPDALREVLIDRIRQGEGGRVYIVRADESRACWRYPAQDCFRVIVAGHMPALYEDRQAAEVELARLLAAGNVDGGFVVSGKRRLIGVQGAGTLHKLVVTAAGMVTADDTTVELPVKPCERKERMYVPAAFFQAMGAVLTAGAAQSPLAIARGETRLTVCPGTSLALRNDVPVRLDDQVFTAQNAVMVPLRSVAEALGGCVSFDEPSGAICINWFTPPAAP